MPSLMNIDSNLRGIEFDQPIQVNYNPEHTDNFEDGKTLNQSSSF